MNAPPDRAVEYGIHHRGRVIVGPDWECEGDVVFGFHGFGEARAVGLLVRHAAVRRAAMADVLAVCDEWDQLSKGETPTTARIRGAIEGSTT